MTTQANCLNLKHHVDYRDISQAKSLIELAGLTDVVDVDLLGRRRGYTKKKGGGHRNKRSIVGNSGDGVLQRRKPISSRRLMWFDWRARLDLLGGLPLFGGGFNEWDMSIRGRAPFQVSPT